MTVAVRRTFRRRGHTVAIALLAAIPHVVALRAQTVTALRPLSFGTVIGGTTGNVDPRSTGALQFDLTGPIGVNGGYLTLPTVLTRSGGGETMPVTFCSTCGVYRITSNDPLGGITFNPANPVLGITVSNGVHVYIWLGGTVSPSVSQLPGAYSGTVVFTLAPII